MVRLAKRDSVLFCTDGARAKRAADSNPRAQVGNQLRDRYKAPLHLHQLDAAIVLPALGRVVRRDGFRSAEAFGDEASAVENLSIRYCRTAAARCSESVWLLAAAPTLSVCPSIASFRSPCSLSMSPISSS